MSEACYVWVRIWTSFAGGIWNSSSLSDLYIHTREQEWYKSIMLVDNHVEASRKYPKANKSTFSTLQTALESPRTNISKIIDGVAPHLTAGKLLANQI